MIVGIAVCFSFPTLRSDCTLQPFANVKKHRQNGLKQLKWTITADFH